MIKHNLMKALKKFLSDNDIRQAVDLLLEFAGSDAYASKYLDEIVIIASNYAELEKQSALNIISFSDEKMERNRIVNSILYILNKLEKNSELLKNYRDDKNPIGIDNKVKIVFLSANPLGEGILRLDKEMREIESELSRAKLRDNFDFIKLSAVRITDLQNVLLDHSPNFIHFAGHGNENGIALLDEDTDRARTIQPKALANLFRLFSNQIICVFLNSCYSGSQAKLIREFVASVVGMKTEIQDSTAIEFAKTFYKGIGSGRSIHFSFELAKNSIDLKNIPGNQIPELL